MLAAVLVAGGPARGLAAARAELNRLARDHGFRTLLTCFNRPLAAYLRASVGDVSGLTVLNFHELCATLARRSGRA